MENQPLYYISIVNTKEPLLLGSERILVIYDDKQKAEISAKKQEEKYVYTSFVATPIEDKTVFFAKMDACNIKKYLLNGDGKLLVASDFGFVENEKTFHDIKDLQQKITQAQPRLKTALPLHPSATKKSANPTLIIFVVIILILIGVFNSGTSDENTSQKKKSGASKEPSYSYTDYMELQKQQQKTQQTTEDALKTLVEMGAIQDESLVKHILEEGENLDSVVGDSKQTSDDANKALHYYYSKIPFSRGTVSKNVYRSEYADLNAELEAGYSWMSLDELNPCLPTDAYQIDWEVGAKGISSDRNMEGLFNIVVGRSVGFEDCMDILKIINPDYTLVSAGGTAWFADVTLAPDEDDISMEVLNQYRAYHRAVFKNDDGIIRQYYFNRVNDRLVCIFQQQDSSSKKEIIIDFTESL